MSDDPMPIPNPFAGLDKALLRQTRPRSVATDDAESSSDRTPNPSALPPTERTSVRADERPDGRTVPRDTTRYAFEFYRDQTERLRRISLEDKLRGGKRGMSEMVREAVDRYLIQLDRETTDRTSGRPDDWTVGRTSGN